MNAISTNKLQELSRKLLLMADAAEKAVQSAFIDSLTLTASCCRTELINENLYQATFGTSVRPGGSSELDRLQVLKRH